MYLQEESSQEVIHQNAGHQPDSIYISQKCQGSLKKVDQRLKKLLMLHLSDKYKNTKENVILFKGRNKQKIHICNNQAMKLCWHSLFNNGQATTQLTEINQYLSNLESFLSSSKSVRKQGRVKYPQNEVDQQILKLQRQYKTVSNYILAQTGRLIELVNIPTIGYQKNFLECFKIEIWKVQLNLFRQTLNQQTVIVHLQQAYPYIKMNTITIKSILGQTQYIKKVDKFKTIKLNCYLINSKDRPTRKIQQAKICHNCCKIIFGKSYNCKAIIRQKISTSNFYTDPFLYRRLEYQPFNYQQDNLKYVHPYYRYSQSLDKSKICNRCYCKLCYHNLNKQLNQDQFVCNYCDGSCICNRCNKIDWIVKALALYLKLNGTIDQVINQFIFPKKNELNVKLKVNDYTLQPKLSKIYALQQKLKKHQKFKKIMAKDIINEFQHKNQSIQFRPFDNQVQDQQLNELSQLISPLNCLNYQYNYIGLQLEQSLPNLSADQGSLLEDE